MYSTGNNIYYPINMDENTKKRMQRCVTILSRKSMFTIHLNLSPSNFCIFTFVQIKMLFPKKQKLYYLSKEYFSEKGLFKACHVLSLHGTYIQKGYTRPRTAGLQFRTKRMMRKSWKHHLQCMTFHSYVQTHGLTTIIIQMS